MNSQLLIEWEILGMKLSLVSRMLGMYSWYCGYVKMPYLIPQNILDEIDVYGGITYTEQEGDQWVYGFDTGFNPIIWTQEQLVAQTESMALQLYSVVHPI